MRKDWVKMWTGAVYCTWWSCVYVQTQNRYQILFTFQFRLIQRTKLADVVVYHIWVVCSYHSSELVLEIPSTVYMLYHQTVLWPESSEETSNSETNWNKSQRSFGVSIHLAVIVLNCIRGWAPKLKKRINTMLLFKFGIKEHLCINPIY